MYCASKECCIALGASRFIDPEVLGNDTRVICPSCNSITCRTCHDLVDATEEEHVCDPAKVDSVVRDFVNSQPEDERWVWQKC